MLKLIMGSSGTGKTQAITTSVLERIQKGEKSFLIVPEQQSLFAEHMLAKILPKSAPRYFEVSTFKHFASTIIRRVSGYSHEHVTPIAEGVLMWETLSELQTLLKSSKIKPSLNTVARMTSIQKELRALYLTPEELSLASKQIEEPSLGNKLSDYSLISSTYASLVEEHFAGHASELEELSSLLQKEKPLENYVLFFDDFNSFTEEEYAVISSLLSQCDVVISLLVPKEPDKQLSAPDVLETKNILLKIATDFGIPYEIEELEEHKREIDPTLLYIKQNIFRSDIASLPRLENANPDAFSLIQTQDPYDAADYIASDIVRLTKEKGARYKDIIIVCSSSENYKGILDASLSKCKIPFFFSYKNGVENLEPIKSILCAYSILNNGWKREDVITYLKTRFSSVSQKASDYLEIYTETWNIHGKRWYEEKEWTNSPDGYQAAHSQSQKDHHDKVLSTINAARAIFVPPLRKLELATKTPMSINEHIVALTNFLQEMKLPELLDKYVKEYSLQGDYELSESYAKLWDILCDVMDTLSSLVGETILPRSGFLNLLKIALSCVSIGHIPPSIDCVTIGEMNTLREGAVPYVYILGANEGELPVPPGLGEAFTEHERLVLQQKEYASDAKLDVNVSRSYAAFSRCIALAKEHLTILFAENNTKFETINPSDAIVRIMRLLPEDYPVQVIRDEELLSMITSPAMAIERLGRCKNKEMRKVLQAELAKCEEYAWVADWDFDQISISNQSLSISDDHSKEYFKDDLALTQSQIEKYNACPFQYYCNYILRLKEPQMAYLNMANIGTFMHAIFEKFFQTVEKNHQDIRSFQKKDLQSVLDSIFDEACEEQFPKKEELTPKIFYQLKRIKNRSLEILWDICREFKSSKFNPSFFEFKIDSKDPAAPQPFHYTLKNGKKVYIYGTIDRVDSYQEDGKTYLRVLDYKTGDKVFNEDKMFEKKDFQLFLYLFSLWKTNSQEFKKAIGAEDGVVLPAAVLYLPALAKESKVEVISMEEAEEEIESTRKRSGVILDEPGLIDSMDSSEKKIYLPISLKKDGTPNANSLDKIWSLDQFENMIPRVGEALVSLAEELTTGSFYAKPDFENNDSPCKYCKYKPICRQEKKDN